MRFLVYEHVTGGGYTNDRIPPSILSEGYAMLRTLILDLKAAGYTVTTFLDARLKRFSPPIEADDIITVTSRHGLNRSLEKLSQTVDCVYIVAPESNRILEKLVGTVEASGGNSLNCRVSAIEEASNKMQVYRTLKEKRMRVPETLLFDLHEDVGQIERMVSDIDFPLIFKPLDGVSCCGLSVVRRKNQIAPAVNKIVKESSQKHFLAQKLIKGHAASVSLISTGYEVSPITLNRQMVRLAPPSSDSSYNGGVVPLHHQSEREALRVAKMAVESLKGLRGYVGVDMVLTGEDPVVMEVNPRLTTSYVGLRKVVNFNPSEAIVDAVLEQKLPESVHTSGYAFFSKVTVPTPTEEALSRTYRLNEVLSPPFPISGSEAAYALLASYATKLREAKMGFHKAERFLIHTLSSGG